MLRCATPSPWPVTAIPISVAVRAMGDREMVGAMLRAAARGARMQLLLDPDSPANQAVAAELMHSPSIDVRCRYRSPKASLSC